MLAILIAFECIIQSDTRKEFQIFTDNISAMPYMIHKGGPSLGSSKVSNGYLGRGDRDLCLDKVRAFTQSREPRKELLVKESQQTQLEA